MTPQERTFFDAVNSLWVQAGAPSARTISRRLGDRQSVSHGPIQDLLRGGKHWPRWATTVAPVVTVLGGDLREFRVLWGAGLRARRDARRRPESATARNLRNALDHIRVAAGLHDLGQAFDPERMRSIANLATRALDGETIPALPDPGRVRSDAAGWAALLDEWTCKYDGPCDGRCGADGCREYRQDNDKPKEQAA